MCQIKEENSAVTNAGHLRKKSLYMFCVCVLCLFKYNIRSNQMK